MADTDQDPQEVCLLRFIGMFQTSLLIHRFLSLSLSVSFEIYLLKELSPWSLELLKFFLSHESPADFVKIQILIQQA